LRVAAAGVSATHVGFLVTTAIVIVAVTTPAGPDTELA